MIPTGVSILQERELHILLHNPEAGTSECGEPAGPPSEGGKALQPYRVTKSWEEVRSLPLYCRECNPRFAPLEAELVALQRMEG